MACVIHRLIYIYIYIYICIFGRLSAYVFVYYTMEHHRTMKTPIIIYVSHSLSQTFIVDLCTLLTIDEYDCVIVGHILYLISKSKMSTLFKHSEIDMYETTGDSG